VAFGLVTAIIPAAAVAQGPNRNEMTGPTIVDDTLFIAVQHPGEDTPIRATAAETQSRRIQILEGDGSGTFEQKRTITKGSQWPSNIQGVESANAIPKPTVVCICRR
jgi:secreted PhoX family phosphatase